MDWRFLNDAMSDQSNASFSAALCNSAACRVMLHTLHTRVKKKTLQEIIHYHVINKGYLNCAKEKSLESTACIPSCPLMPTPMWAAEKKKKREREAIKCQFICIKYKLQYSNVKLFD